MGFPKTGFNSRNNTNTLRKVTEEEEKEEEEEVEEKVVMEMIECECVCREWASIVMVERTLS